jgi:hypothetical protein
MMTESQALETLAREDPAAAGDAKAALDRYAGVCSSAGTKQIITAYPDGHQEGIAAYSEAIEASNAAPPDTGLLAWGSVMGVQERATHDACAAALELAFACGELNAGRRDRAAGGG